MLVSDDCLVSRGYGLFYVSLSSVTRKLHVITIYAQLTLAKLFCCHDLWFKRETRQPSLLSLSFSLLQSNLLFSFLHVTLFAVFLIPPILRSHYSAVELCNGARGYQLNEFCPVASIYCAPSQMQGTLCVCWIWLHICAI